MHAARLCNEIEIQWSIIIDIITCIVHAWLDDTFSLRIIFYIHLFMYDFLCLYLKECIIPQCSVHASSSLSYFSSFLFIISKNLFCLNHFELTGGSRGPIMYSFEFVRVLELLNEF
ncbi:hypothetical protein ACKWTF_000191 [Chironomus riparius]